MAIDAQWNIILGNQAYLALGAAMLPAQTIPPANVLHGLFDPQIFRPRIKNFPDLAPLILGRLRREATIDRRNQKLLEDLLNYPDLPIELNTPSLNPAELLVPTQIDLGEVSLSTFSTIATLGTAMDITLQEIRVESYFPADEVTERYFEGLASS